MTTVYYSRWQLIWHGLLICFGAPPLRTFMTLVGGGPAMATGVYAFGLPIGGLRFLWMALGDTVALRADRDGLFIRDNWQTRTIPWSRVAGVGIEQFDAYTLAITKNPLRCLTLRELTQTSGIQNVRLIRSLLALTEPELDAVVAQLIDADRLTQKTQLPVMASCDPADNISAPEDGFDPDAIIARYLETRSVTPSSVPAPRRFGRKEA